MWYARLIIDVPYVAYLRFSLELTVSVLASIILIYAWCLAWNYIFDIERIYWFPSVGVYEVFATLVVFINFYLNKEFFLFAKNCFFITLAVVRDAFFLFFLFLPQWKSIPFISTFSSVPFISTMKTSSRRCIHLLKVKFNRPRVWETICTDVWTIFRLCFYVVFN